MSKPQLFLSDRALRAADAGGDMARRGACRAGDPTAIGDFLESAGRAGFSGLCTLDDIPTMQALQRFLPRKKEAAGFRVLPLAPNMPAFVRDATQHGMAGAGLRKLFRAGPMGMWKAGWAGIFNAPRILKKEFGAFVAVLNQLEMSGFSPFRPQTVYLHHQMTDMMLGFDNRAFFDFYARFARRQWGVEPGLATANFARLAEKLAIWETPIQHFIAPLNRQNWCMPGGLEAVMPHLGKPGISVLACRVFAGYPTPPEAVQWALGLPGVTGAIVDGATPPFERYFAAAQE